MKQHITIGFNKPQAMIAIFLSRFGLDTYNISIVHDNPDIMIDITDTYLKIGKTQITYPLLLNDVIYAIKATAMIIN